MGGTPIGGSMAARITALLCVSILSAAGLTIKADPASAVICSGIHVYPGDSLPLKASNAPTGATLCIHPGVYRPGKSIQPRSGQKFIGYPGAVISGAKLVTNWTKPGKFWVSTGQTSQYPKLTGPVCDRTPAACFYEDVFYDGKPLRHVRSLSVLSSGEFFFDYANNRIYIANSPFGHRLETTNAKAGFEPSASNVTVRGLVVEKFAYYGIHASNWLVENNLVRMIHGIGIRSTSGSMVRNNAILRNGRMGITGAGRNIHVVGNEVAYNNTALFDGWAAGGSKWGNAVGVTIRGNHFHDNWGQGIWADLNAKDVLIENNLSQNNGGQGIAAEISYDVVIRNNRSLNNGQNGIFVAYTPNVVVTGNTVAGNRNGGISLYQKKRGSGPFGPHELRNVSVHDNKISMSRGTTGLRVANEISDNSYFTSRNIKFTGNDYVLGSQSGKYFHWQRKPRTKLEWQRFGHDTFGTFRFGG